MLYSDWLDGFQRRVPPTTVSVFFPLEATFPACTLEDWGMPIKQRNRLAVRDTYRLSLARLQSGFEVP
jgi:hypothetical protein